MRQRTRIIVSILTGVAALALTLVYTSSVESAAYAQQKETMERYGGDLVEVCVATRDIEAGETIDDACVSVDEWVATLLPADAYIAMRDVEGKQATSRIPKNTVLCPDYFERHESALEVPRGKVAVSVAVDEEHAVGGALALDDYVDVYASKDGVADRLCGARIIDTSVEKTDGGTIAWATLAVDPDDVSELLAAAAKGSINLVVPDDATAEVDADEAEDEAQVEAAEGEEGSDTGAPEGDAAADDAEGDDSAAAGAEDGSAGDTEDKEASDEADEQQKASKDSAEDGDGGNAKDADA